MKERDEGSLAVHLRALEESLLSAAVRANPEAVSALLTYDFREFGSSGRVFTKDMILAELADEEPRVLRLSDFNCTPLRTDCALVTYRSHRTLACGGTATALRSSLWLRQEDGQWKMYFHQGTIQQTAGDDKGA